MSYTKLQIIGYRCDKPMRRSKEKGYISPGRYWKCTEDCKSCICCIFKDEYGGEYHRGVNYK